MRSRAEAFPHRSGNIEISGRRYMSPFLVSFFLVDFIARYYFVYLVHFFPAISALLSIELNPL